MNTTRHLLTIAEAYSDATGLSLTDVSRLASGTSNNVVLHRIRDGKSCLTSTLDTMLAWFDENWPAGVPWPEGILRGPPLQIPEREREKSCA